MHVFGLTGGIACGKTFVASILKEHGVHVIDTDTIAKACTDPGHPVLDRIRRTFGAKYISADGTLDRRELGGLIFDDETARGKLNSIIHPFVYKEVWRQLFQCYSGRQDFPTPIESDNPLHRPTRSPIVAIDIPLLYETGAEKSPLLREWPVVVVGAQRTQQISRLMARNNLTEAEAESRVSSQMDIEDKIAQADIVIDNSGTPAETCAQVLDLVRHFEASMYAARDDHREARRAMPLKERMMPRELLNDIGGRTMSGLCRLGYTRAKVLAACGAGCVLAVGAVLVGGKVKRRRR
ncbi:dephospho-CoA kinase [Kipferlia bialata]|uniref:Dephospho-CoA kinase n=1 Tax=Kipferlia bialata TaxID=797122 RepID=A0A9K3CWA4_9EUKA|nr:dephospho-CoA kinase [Kipferlia bialata]|eukprot:g4814.t1